MSGVMIVTGAGRGIGAAIAKRGATDGFAVCVNYARNHSHAEAVVADINAAGGTAVAVQADVAHEDEILRLFETCDQQLGPVTTLINNAGIVGRRCLVSEINAADLDEVFRINVFGYFLCAREAFKRMSTQRGHGGGVIVNVSSIAVHHGGAFNWVHYAASKAAIDTFTLGLAKEAIDHGIRVNAVRAGMTDTDINPADNVASIPPTIPIKRMAEPNEIAEAVVWMASDKASYCVGTVMDVSGGRH